MRNIRKNILLTFLGLSFLFFAAVLQAQSLDEESHKNWDNQIYIGNKVAAAKDHWRFSGELQVRLKDNMGQLDNWYMEGVATYMYSEKIEIVPDFRISIKPDNEIEYRPGLGVIYKFTKSKFQFVNQLKWQIDMDNKDNFDNGLRYAIFTNRVLTEKIISSFAFGAFYRWRSEGWNGFQFIKFARVLVM